MTAMTEHDVIDVLTAIAAFDQRTVGEADVQAWTLAARHGGWEQASYAMRAVVEHHTFQTDRIMPAHITRRIREQREYFASTFRCPPSPHDMRDVEDQLEWEQQHLREHIQAGMNEWAAGEDRAA